MFKIFLTGHGTRDKWLAMDCVVSTDDIEKWSKVAQKKKGYFLQVTCGTSSGFPLGYPIMENQNHCLGYTKTIGIFTYLPVVKKLETLGAGK